MACYHCKLLPAKTVHASGVRPEARTTAIHVLILGAWPLLLVLVNDFWAYTGTQSPYLDPWFYVSYFLHLKSQLLAFPQVYFGDRVSYTVPGWLLFRLFGPVLGNSLFRLLIIYVAIFSLYFAAVRLFDRRTALFSSLLLVVSPYFLIAFGWSYTDGPAIAYYALSLYLIVRAATADRWRLAMAGSGVCAMLSVSTHFLFLNLIWTLPLAYVLFTWREHRDRVWQGIVAFAVGTVAAFVACCAAYYNLTARWFYLANSVNHTLHGFKPAQHVNRPVSEWIGGSYWLVHYNVISALVLWLLFRRSTDRRQRLCLSLFGVAYATVWLWQAVGFPFTMIFWYTSFLFPVYLLALSAIVRDPVQDLSTNGYRAAIAVVLLAGGGLIMFAGPLARALGVVRGALGDAHPAIWLSLIGIAICVPGIAAWKRGAGGYAAFVAGLLLVGSVQLSNENFSGWFAAPPGSGYTNAQGYRLIVDADAWLDRQLPNRRLMHWFNNGEKGGPILTGLCSLYIDEWSLLNRQLPLLRAEDSERIDKEPNVVLASFDRQKIEDGVKTLRSADWNIEKRIDNTVRSGPLELHMALLSLEPAVLRRPGMQRFPDVLRLEAIQASGTAHISYRSDGIDFVTATQQWLYDGSLPLDFASDHGDPVLLQISAKVLRGDVNIGILRSTGTFGKVRQLHPSAEFQKVVLELGDDTLKKAMIISNATYGGQSAELLINHIDVNARADSALGKRLRDAAAHSKIQ